MRGRVDEERGVILEIDGRDALVLTPAGDFRRVRLDRPGRLVGEEIPLAAAPAPRAAGRFLGAGRFLWPGAATVVAAAALLAIVVLPAVKRPAGGPDRPGEATVAARVMAYVTVDINPSFELAVDGSGKVVRARALNGDAELILALVDVAGKPVDEAVARLAEGAMERGFLAPERENNVVIAAVPAEGNPDLPPAVRDQVEAGRIKVKDALAHRALPAEVVALAAPAPELKAEAAQKGVSVGKYLIWLEMQKEGLSTPVEDLRDRPIGKVIREQGLVPGEVIRRAENEEEMKSLIDDFRKRLQAEERGGDGGDGATLPGDGRDDGKELKKRGRKEDRKGSERRGEGRDGSGTPAVPPQEKGDGTDEQGADSGVSGSTGGSTTEGGSTGGSTTEGGSTGGSTTEGGSATEGDSDSGEHHQGEEEKEH